MLDQSPDAPPSEAGRSILVPRFTIRTLLLIITVCAIIFVMIGTATRGQYWAWGVTISLVSLLVAAFTHAAWFGIVSLFVHLWQRQERFSKQALRQVRMSPDAAAGGELRTGAEVRPDGRP